MNLPEPTAPPIATDDLPASGGQIGSAPEDFIVREIPLYLPSGEGPHIYLHLRKREWTTPDALRVIARAAGCKDRDIGSAGLKDRNAVTEQWISLPPGATVPEPGSLPAGLEILSATPHRNKLRTGHLKGNHFSLRLVDVASTEAARAIADALRARGAWNGFGAQRFGRGARNISRALEWIRRDERGQGKATRFQKKMYPSALQSEVFNRYIHLRISAGMDHVLSGEVVRLAGTGSHFVVEDAAAEQERWASGDLEPTGPMAGPKGLQAAGEAAAIEAQAIADAGLTEDDLVALGRFAPGARRDLRLPLDDLELTVEGDTMVLAFSLPAGGYATLVSREFTRAPFLAEDDAS